jgi:hypothetical protein
MLAVIAALERLGVLVIGMLAMGMLAMLVLVRVAVLVVSSGTCFEVVVNIIIYGTSVNVRPLNILVASVVRLRVVVSRRIRNPNHTAIRSQTPAPHVRSVRVRHIRLPTGNYNADARGAHWRQRSIRVLPRRQHRDRQRR